ncbi:hypothetical protein U1Q18_039208, partial [Sarracenia purpurea var. burkii]
GEKKLVGETTEENEMMPKKGGTPAVKGMKNHRMGPMIDDYSSGGENTAVEVQWRHWR